MPNPTTENSQVNALNERLAAMQALLDRIDTKLAALEAFKAGLQSSRAEFLELLDAHKARNTL